jgi:hypothetical protein
MQAKKAEQGERDPGKGGIWGEFKKRDPAEAITVKCSHILLSSRLFYGSSHTLLSMPELRWVCLQPDCTPSRRDAPAPEVERAPKGKGVAKTAAAEKSRLTLAEAAASGHLFGFLPDKEACFAQLPALLESSRQLA